MPAATRAEHPSGGIHSPVTRKRLRRFLLIGVAWFAGAHSAAAQATVEGTVPLSARPVSAAINQRYQAAGGVVATPEPPTAVVYLEGTFPAPATNAMVYLGQTNLQFNLALLPVQKGTLVAFPNQDEVYHNVFSYSKTKRFDLGRYRRDDKPAVQKFETPGTVKLFCEIHEHMRATILVLDTPYFVKTDAQGKYRLTNLPAGKYKLKAWLDDKVILEKPVELKLNETIRVDFPGK
jgi:plastocyanin